MDEHSGAPSPPPKRVTVTDRRKIHTGPAGGEEASPPEAPGSAAPTPPAPAPEDLLRKAQEEAASHLDDLRRLKAEFENYRKRIMKDQAELGERASAGLVGRLLIVLDNFGLAVAAAEESHDFERMLRGIEMVFGELKEVLAAEGLAEIQARAQAFDPNYHEAALEVPGDEDGEPVVAEVLRPGYTFKGKVLRPAMVKVARRRRGDAVREP